MDYAKDQGIIFFRNNSPIFALKYPSNGGKRHLDPDWWQRGQRHS